MLFSKEELLIRFDDLIEVDKQEYHKKYTFIYSVSHKKFYLKRMNDNMHFEKWNISLEVPLINIAIICKNSVRVELGNRYDMENDLIFDIFSKGITQFCDLKKIKLTNRPIYYFRDKVRLSIKIPDRIIVDCKETTLHEYLLSNDNYQLQNNGNWNIINKDLPIKFNFNIGPPYINNKKYISYSCISLNINTSDILKKDLHKECDLLIKTIHINQSPNYKGMIFQIDV